MPAASMASPPFDPDGRARTADEVASAIAFLLSPRSSYTTGVVLDVTGGLGPDEAVPIRSEHLAVLETPLQLIAGVNS